MAFVRMMNFNMVKQLKYIIYGNPSLCKRIELQLQTNAQENSDLQTNPVRSLEDLYAWLERFLTVMPWEGLAVGTKSKEQGLFRRIDQATGYFYYLFGDLQYEPRIAEWIKQYNAAWAKHLNSSESWNEEYYNLLKSDPLFELNTDKYESPENWHTWNDFFSRRLAAQQSTPAFVAEGQQHPWLPIDADNCLQLPEAIKTTDIFDIKALLGKSRYNEAFANGSFTHITLDMYNYHHFHSPVDGKIVDIQEIDGQLSSGGEIIWDAEQGRYRYKYEENLGYQMIEKRVVIVVESGIRSQESGNQEQGAKTATLKEQGQFVAIVTIGVAQVGSIYIEKDIQVDAEVHHGQDLGHFLCGGSDVIVLRSKEQRPPSADG